VLWCCWSKGVWTPCTRPRASSGFVFWKVRGIRSERRLSQKQKSIQVKILDVILAISELPRERQRARWKFESLLGTLHVADRQKEWNWESDDEHGDQDEATKHGQLWDMAWSGSCWVNEWDGDGDELAFNIREGVAIVGRESVTSSERGREMSGGHTKEGDTTRGDTWVRRLTKPARSGTVPEASNSPDRARQSRHAWRDCGSGERSPWKVQTAASWIARSFFWKVA
jgi:hypothetical protein